MNKESKAWGFSRHTEPCFGERLSAPQQLKNIVLLCGLWLCGCVSVPPEASALSEQLGSRLTAIERAHRNLVEDFFVQKRQRVDEYIDEVWLPVFAQEFFADPANQALWSEVIASNNRSDPVRFVMVVGPALQQNINAQRTQLIKPLDELEQEVLRQISAEYQSAQSMNQSLTAYLHTVSDIGENRTRYLSQLGVDEGDLTGFIEQADAAVTRLINQVDTVGDYANSVSTYQESLNTLLEELGVQ